MKTIVNLRHAQRQDHSDEDSHLSQLGVDQAKRVGARYESFDLVVSSPLPRAVETAIAMGFAVDIREPLLGEWDDETMREPEWDTGFGYASWADAYRLGRRVASYVDQRLPLLQSWIDEIPPGGSLLIVSHGGVVEALTLGLAPDANHAELGDSPGQVEGVLVVYDDDGGCTLRQVRVD